MFERDLFYGLLSYAKRGGWFEADARLLRAALYAPCLGKVSEREIQDGLRKMREVQMLKLWTGKNGRAYGSIVNYGQRYEYGEALPAEAHPPDDELPLGLGDLEPPPSPPPQVEKSVSETREARNAHTKETDAQWRERLAGRYAGVDLASEIRSAERYVKRQRGESARLTRRYFEREWLPRCEGVVSARAASQLPSPSAEPELEGWREVIRDSVYGPGQPHEVSCWAHLPPVARDFVRKQLQRGA